MRYLFAFALAFTFGCSNPVAPESTEYKACAVCSFPVETPPTNGPMIHPKR